MVTTLWLITNYGSVQSLKSAPPLHAFRHNQVVLTSCLYNKHKVIF